MREKIGEVGASRPPFSFVFCSLGREEVWFARRRGGAEPFGMGREGDAAGLLLRCARGVLPCARPTRSRTLRPLLVILTKVRTQSPAATAFVTLDPDFRQDDGVGVGCRSLRRGRRSGCPGGWASLGVVRTRVSARARPAPVILTKVRIQSQAAPAIVILGPDVRQDDGCGVRAVCLSRWGRLPPARGRARWG